MAENTRVAGHELLYEGAPHNLRGGRIGGFYGGVGGEGHGKCSCGTVSPLLSSGAQRKAWHRRHKERIRDERTPTPDRPALGAARGES